MKTIVLVLFMNFEIFSQGSTFNVIQITNIAGDAENVFIPINPLFPNSNFDLDVYFEIHKNGISNIASSSFNEISGNFSEPDIIVEDSAININPGVFLYSPTNDFTYGNDIERFLFYQTNKNGNWDIAYKILKDSTWFEEKYVVNSPEDETNPTIPQVSGDNAPDSVRILFEKNNSIYMAIYQDTTFVIQKVFSGSDSLVYSQPAGSHNCEVVAAKKIINNKSLIVYKTKMNIGGWSKEYVVSNTGDCDNPKFLNINFEPMLTYENTLNGHTNVYIMNYPDSNYVPLIDSAKGDITTLRTVNIPMTTQSPFKRSMSVSIIPPYSYKYAFNDSTFIDVETRSSANSNVIDTLIYTRVSNRGLALGASGSYNHEITVWEDSVSGHVQLFANISDIVSGVIKVHTMPENFYLSQNYPNPFNPSTVISYSIPEKSFISLKVYDILGREVATLVNQTSEPGTYNVSFNGEKLASGVYFYRLHAGNFIQTKKLLLLK